MAAQSRGAAPTYASWAAGGIHRAGLGDGDPALSLHGGGGRYGGRGQEDDTSRAGNLFRPRPAPARPNLFDNVAGPLRQVPADVVQGQLALFDRADPAYGAGVRAALEARGVKPA